MSCCCRRLDSRKNFQQGGAAGREMGKEGWRWNLLFQRPLETSSQPPVMVRVEVRSQGGRADSLPVEAAFLGSWGCLSTLLSLLGFTVPTRELSWWGWGSGLFSCPGLRGPRLCTCLPPALAPEGLLYGGQDSQDPQLFLGHCPVNPHTPTPQPWADFVLG